MNQDASQNNSAKQAQHKSNIIYIAIIGFLVIIVCALLGIIALMLATRNEPSQFIDPEVTTPRKSIEPDMQKGQDPLEDVEAPIEEADPDQTMDDESIDISNWSQYSVDQLENINLEPFTLYYPDSWDLETQGDGENFFEVNLSKAQFTMQITGGAFGGNDCYFENFTPGPVNSDYTDVDFVELGTEALGTVRYFPHPSSGLDEYQFCFESEERGMFNEISEIGLIKVTPKSAMPAGVQEELETILMNVELR